MYFWWFWECCARDGPASDWRGKRGKALLAAGLSGKPGPGRGSLPDRTRGKLAGGGCGRQGGLTAAIFGEGLPVGLVICFAIVLVGGLVGGATVFLRGVGGPLAVVVEAVVLPEGAEDANVGDVGFVYALDEAF
jgi:hypothetical protein